MKIFIDGYNVINKWPQLIGAKRKSIELARSELFDIIESYCNYTGADAVIVFDGSGEARSAEDGNPKVIFSKKGESADTVIESLVYNMGDKSKTRVVSDDRVHGNLISGMGAMAVSAKVFEQEVKSASSSLRDFIESRQHRPKRGIEL